jgi:hypothetical protein
VNTIATNIATEINRWHDLATEHAAQAVEHAQRAGALLLEVKAMLPHGEFLPWVRANVHVTARQAQRYMAAAQGKQPAPKLKSDSTSHLSAPQANGPTPTAPDWQPRPNYMPRDGHKCLCVGDGRTYVVEPSLAHPGFWFVSVMREEDYDCQARPIRADWVELTLEFYGLKCASAAEWAYAPCAGVRIGMESLLSEESVQERLSAPRETVAAAIDRMKRTNERMGAAA